MPDAFLFIASCFSCSISASTVGICAWISATGIGVVPFSQIIELTAEEVSQAETNDAEFQLKLQQEEQEKQDATTKKESGKQKLKDLGLDDAEIKALIGA